MSNAGLWEALALEPSHHGDRPLCIHMDHPTAVIGRIWNSRKYASTHMHVSVHLCVDVYLCLCVIDTIESLVQAYVKRTQSAFPSREERTRPWGSEREREGLSLSLSLNRVKQQSRKSSASCRPLLPAVSAPHCCHMMENWCQEEKTGKDKARTWTMAGPKVAAWRISRLGQKIKLHPVLLQLQPLINVSTS